MPAQFKDLALNSILVTLVVIAGLSAAQMASRTLLNRHPDEVYHVDAFCYFQDHWRPPDLNSDEVIYSPYGWSRVYTGEAVYVVFGQLSKAGNLVGQRNASPQASAQEVAERSCRNLDFRQFRFMNVALYVLTLATVFAMGRRDFWTIALGVGLVAIPQVVYVYSYANSDAWGLSLSIFLLLYALRLARKDNVSAWRAAGLGLLTGLVLLTKKPYWLTIPFAYLFLGAGVYAKFRAGDANVRHRSAVLLFLALFTATIVAGPLLVVYPWTQGDFAADELAMREKRAMDGFKPSDPTYEGLQLATRGEPFRAVWMDREWWSWSAMSSYGMFGYMAVFLPVWMYAVAAVISLLGLGFTFDTLTQRWREIPTITYVILVSAVVMIAVNVFASLYNSWAIDYQPQGRYLLPSLLPLAYLWAGLYDLEPDWMRKSRWILLAVLWAVGLYALWFVTLRSPMLLT